QGGIQAGVLTIQEDPERRNRSLRNRNVANEQEHLWKRGLGAQAMDVCDSILHYGIEAVWRFDPERSRSAQSNRLVDICGCNCRSKIFRRLRLACGSQKHSRVHGCQHGRIQADFLPTVIVRAEPACHATRPSSPIAGQYCSDATRKWDPVATYRSPYHLQGANGRDYAGWIPAVRIQRL